MGFLEVGNMFKDRYLKMGIHVLYADTESAGLEVLVGTYLVI